MLGLIAAVALAIYALYFYAIVKLIPVMLTLPGIAGLILTLGVAADANIVIFERVKEEIRAGRSIGAAIPTGYKKGLTAIIDANIVTFLVAFILFILATAGVQGLRVHARPRRRSVSLFTAVLATQAILYSLRSTRAAAPTPARSAPARARPMRSFDFMGASKWFFSMSGVILLIGALAIAGKGINFGIDFESRHADHRGARRRRRRVEEVRNVLGRQGYGDAKIQTVANPELGRNVVQISTATLGPRRSTRSTTRCATTLRHRAAARGRVDRPDVRQDRRELGDHRDHRLADRDHRSTSRCDSSGSSRCRC